MEFKKKRLGISISTKLKLWHSVVNSASLSPSPSTRAIYMYMYLGLTKGLNSQTPFFDHIVRSLTWITFIATCMYVPVDGLLHEFLKWNFILYTVYTIYIYARSLNISTKSIINYCKLWVMGFRVWPVKNCFWYDSIFASQGFWVFFEKRCGSITLAWLAKMVWQWCTQS